MFHEYILLARILQTHGIIQHPALLFIHARNNVYIHMWTHDFVCARASTKY